MTKYSNFNPPTISLSISPTKLHFFKWVIFKGTLPLCVGSMKKHYLARCQWLTSVIPANWEEVGLKPA
jgi:hypothetical protein